MVTSLTKCLNTSAPVGLTTGALRVFLAAFLMLIGGQGLHAGGFDFVQTTGRAVIMHQDMEQEARMMALEDALYLAALQGGAQINGFSLIATDTAIDDHFVVRPASRILDYRIVNEVIAEEHYEVTIEAAVGELPEIECQAREHSNVTVYAPTIGVKSTAPPWSRQFADVVLDDMVMQLDQEPTLNLQNASRTKLDSAALARSNDSFDYTALTTGRVRVGRGDYAIIPEIRLSGDRSHGSFSSNYTMTMQISLRLLSGVEYEELFDHTMTHVIKIEQNSLIRSLDVITRPKRQAILAAMRTPIANFVTDFSRKLKCRPLKVELEYANGNLTAPLGTRHGVGVNSLAIALGTDTPWQILRVSAAGPLSATLTPLNSRRDVANLAGQMIEFMELK
jgi:hypothetical protein